jgi:hypothetical protein
MLKAEEAGFEIISWIGSKREFKIAKAFHFILEIVSDNQKATSRFS